MLLSLQGGFHSVPGSEYAEMLGDPLELASGRPGGQRRFLSGLLQLGVDLLLGVEAVDVDVVCDAA
ncbi:hypothetical protein ACWD5Q_23180, partial [Streptomyces sp. NPDC002513]